MMPTWRGSPSFRKQISVRRSIQGRGHSYGPGSLAYRDTVSASIEYRSASMTVHTGSGGEPGASAGAGVVSVGALSGHGAFVRRLGRVEFVGLWGRRPVELVVDEGLAVSGGGDDRRGGVGPSSLMCAIGGIGGTWAG